MRRARRGRDPTHIGIRQEEEPESRRSARCSLPDRRAFVSPVTRLRMSDPRRAGAVRAAVRITVTSPGISSSREGPSSSSGSRGP